MYIEEWLTLLNESNLFSINFNELDAKLAFNLSMISQVNELSDDRFLKLTFVEFLEAVVRIADKISLPQYGV